MNLHMQSLGADRSLERGECRMRDVLSCGPNDDPTTAVECFLARFRQSDSSVRSRDFVVLLDFEPQGDLASPRVWRHMMTCSRDTTLSELWHEDPTMQRVRANAFWGQGVGDGSVANGLLNASVEVRQELIAGQPM